MPADDGQRKLTAILAADVAGYSRLMADDDRETVRTLTAFREVFAEQIESRQGRIVDTAGDSVLATFESVIEAVEAAVEIQRLLGERNGDISGHRQMHFRMGVNIGDIIVRDDGTVYGDGVNVAARLEALAEPGGVMVSEDVHRYVDGKLDVGLADAGAHEVKNIAKPVRAFRVVMDGAEEVVAARSSGQVFRRPKVVAGLALAIAALIGLAVWGVTVRVEAPQMVTAEGVPTDDPVLAMPTGPAIAVLPFENLSDGSDDDFFANGLTEDLIVGLSRFPTFLVIARNSTLHYKGQSVDVREVGRDLGARYVVSGSVRRTANSLRVSIHLLDGEDGTDLWAETYDRDLDAENLFEVQDEIISNISATVGDTSGMVIRAEMSALRERRPESLSGYECWLRLTAYYDAISPKAHSQVRDCAEKAVEVDPRFAEGWATLGYMAMDEHRFGLNPLPDSMDRSIAAFRKALEVDGKFQEARHGLAEAMFASGNVDAFLVEAERAIALNPNNATTLVALGNKFVWAGYNERGMALARKAIAINPFHPSWYYFTPAAYHYVSGEFETSLAAALKIEWVELHWTQMLLAANYGQLGRAEKARAAIAELLELYPDYAAHAWREFDTWNLPTDTRVLFAEGLAKAGLEVQISEPMAQAPTLPVIAVLPFDNMSGDPEQDYFADGITEDIITRLAQFPNILVLGRNTTFQFKGQAVDIPTIAEKLGADYVVEGSIRRGGETVRVTAQLLGADGGTHLWAEAYDRALDTTSLFAIQDEIASSVAVAIGDPYGAIGEAEFKRFARQTPEHLSSYDCVLRFFEYGRLVNVDRYRVARDCLDKVIEEEPDYADALAHLSNLHVDDIALGYNAYPESSMETAVEFGKRAVALDPKSGLAHAELSKALILTDNPKRAVREAEEALRLAPNNSQVIGRAGDVFQLAGAYQRAKDTMEKLELLNPNYPPWMNWVMAKYHLSRGEYSDAVVRLEMVQMEWWHWTTAFLAASHCAHGDLVQGSQDPTSGSYFRHRILAHCNADGGSHPRPKPVDSGERATARHENGGLLGPLPILYRSGGKRRPSTPERGRGGRRPATL